MPGTGCAGVRGHARSHRACAGLELPPYLQEQLSFSNFEKPARFTCGSGLAREVGDAVSGTGCAGVRGHARSHRGSALAWSCRRTCRSNCLSQNLKSLRDSPVGAGKPAKQGTRCLAPAAPVFAGMPAPTGPALAWSCRRTCRSNCLSQNLKSLRDSPVGAGKPAKQATRCLAPAAPVFAGTPAPTGTAYKPPPDSVSGFAETRECARQPRCTRPTVRPRPCGHAPHPGSHHPLPAKGKTPAPPSHAGLRTNHE